MEGCVTEGNPPTAGDDEKLKETDSVVNFQRFVYDLFEKNGILNDLRVYLRGHIVDVLKSAQTGEPPTCQKHFTQRLELTYQALNMLIAEYLLRLEFSYSLSVFVSEIPLANMVFSFAKKMMNSEGDFEDLRFKDNDVWSILNYLGIKCDSEHASHIVEMYNGKGNLPLLFCILKCMPMYSKETWFEGQAVSSSESLSSSAKSIDFPDEKHARSASKVGSAHDKCKHYVFCRACQARMGRLKEKYRAKKKHFIKNIKSNDVNPLKVGTLMKNIDVMERTLVDEMFQQLKGVYEAEVEMVKQDEEKKIKRSLASHALQLQRRRDEMEESFKACEAELERNVQEKKKFLWGLARALRDQHATMARAMHAVRSETDRLTAKEDSLKSQLLEAEEVLRKRGEDMRKQISNELVILEEHLESMKRERENIHRERAELETLKTACDSSCVIKVHDLNNEELRSHYDLLKDELGILKKYIETTKLEPKCVIERSTLTELSDVSSKVHVALNNETAERVPRDHAGKRTPNKLVNDLKKQKNVNFCTLVGILKKYIETTKLEPKCVIERSTLTELSDVSSKIHVALNNETAERVPRDHAGERTPNKLVNDLKKQKNVNFCTSNVDELYREGGPDHSRSRSSSSEVGDAETADRELVRTLREENERLKAFARQQRLHIDELTSHQARVQAELTASRLRADVAPRPRTAPTLMPHPPLLRLNTSASVNSVGWRKGAGEELSLFTGAQPRVLLPGDTLPFIGVLRDRHTDNRRHLINQWRALRRRMSPLGAGHARDRQRDRTGTANPTPILPSQNDEDIGETTRPHHNETFTFTAVPRERPKTAVTQEVTERIDRGSRDSSPQPASRETKEMLRNKTYVKERDGAGCRSGSPGAVLREAKLRLRKLETEADAVERSYLDFRRRQAGRRHNGAVRETTLGEDVITNIDIHRSRSRHRMEEGNRDDIPHFTITHEPNTSKRDFDKYLCVYQTKLDDAVSHFKGTNNVAKTKPIPVVYSKIEPDECQERGNYLETPLQEFRKLYTQMSPMPSVPVHFPRTESPVNIAEAKVGPDSGRESTESRSKSMRSVRSKKDELEILKENISKMYNLQDQGEIEQKLEGAMKNESPKEDLKENLIVEVEPVSESNSLKVTESNTQGDLLLVVESTIDTREIDVAGEVQRENISTHMTIIVSPKRSMPNGIKNVDKSPDRSERSVSPEQAARLTRNDALNAIFHADASKQQSSIEMELNISKDMIEDSISDYGKGDDYPDDFSADVDNYNSRSDYENDHSPISLPKNSEDDNFWDS